MSGVDKNQCRLCGERRAIKQGRHPLLKESFSKNILQFTGLDVAQDHSGCPPYICTCCQCKLKRATKIKNKDIRKGTVNFNVPDFPAPDSSLPEGLNVLEDHAGCPPDVHTPEGAVNFSVPEFPDPELTATPPTPHQVFTSKAKQLAQEHNLIDSSDNETLVFLSLLPGVGSTLFDLTIKRDYSWSLKYKNVAVPHDSDALSTLPTNLHIGCLPDIFNCLKFAVCEGNNDFADLVAEYSVSGNKNLVSHDKKTPVGYVHSSTIRSIICPILMTERKDTCIHCTELRANLRARRANLKSKLSNPSPTDKTKASSKVSYVNLTKEELVIRMQCIKKDADTKTRLIKVLQLKLESKLEEESVNVTPDQKDFLCQVVRTNQKCIESQWEDGSAQKLFWDEQIKRSKLKGPQGMRWHPTIIRWCISLYMKGPSSYRQLAKCGFFALPSASTIKCHLNFTQSLPGINIEVMKVIAKEFFLPTADESKKNVALVWDEVKVKAGLAVGRGSGKLIGFECLDNFSEELHRLSKLDSKDVSAPKEATHLLVFMVRSLTTNLNLPFLWYPCTGCDSRELNGCVWTATQSLELMGLKVRAWVCDGASANRSFFQLNSNDNALQFCTWNHYGSFETSRNVYFFCDVPHLLKTTRNNLENSHSNSHSKTLMKNGKSISWGHITSTFKDDASHHLNKLVKIKDEHLHLSPQLRMRVKLAAQILSTSMANAITARNIFEMAETSNFCRIFDKWFDCLNGRYLLEHKEKRKPNLSPYFGVADERLEWLASDFLGWLNEWESEVNSIPGLSKSQRNKFMLSQQTVAGLRITTQSFTTLCKEMLAEDGVEFLLPEKLNQDRLEVFFGRLRRSCGDNDNPTVEEARHRILALLVAGRHFIAPRNTNSVAYFDAENIYLPKKKAKKNIL